MKLLAATNNKKKLLEIIRILEPMGIEIASLSEVGIDIEVAEAADSFIGNARLKARAIHNLSHMPTIADDSGLCVNALEGAPGVYSARFGGEGLTDVGRYELLLNKMEDKTDRSAKFVSAICCILNEDTVLECEGECKGEIAYSATGSGGFGYDPIFLVDGKSYSELSDTKKDEISHRGRALRKLKDLLLKTQNFGERNGDNA